jgi:YidC/Oxa1 family membrane protein insertase
VGFFGLGPYFNLLPILTIVLFIWQQKKVMPPPTDEQQAVQQKVMQFMMIFMGFLFFKVASGLCIYFIASSLWGLAERRYLPKMTPPATSAGVPQPAKPQPQPRPGSGNNAPAAKKKSRDKR